MRRFALLAAVAAVSVLGAGPAMAQEAEAWRLFVSDHAKGAVTVVDALEREIIAEFAIDGLAGLYRTESGETVFAVQGSAGAVDAIGSGIAFDDHGDHGDIDLSAPRLTGFRMDGAKPAHFVERQGLVAMWFDGEDKARLFSERDALRGNAGVSTVDIQAAHHGVGVPYDGHAVVTIPDPQDPSKRPVGARIVKGEDEQVGEAHSCPGLHGSAGTGNLYALACDTGLLLIEARGGVPKIRHLAYPDTLPEGSASTLIGGRGIQYFVGNYGADRVVLIDPTEADGFRLVQLPTRRVHFTVDPVRPKFVYVITEDGRLHQLDVLKGEIAASLQVTQAYSMDGHWSDPRPRVAVAGNMVIVTDPLEGRLHFVDAGSFTPAGDMSVDGKPFNIVAVGGAGQIHVTE